MTSCPRCLSVRSSSLTASIKIRRPLPQRAYSAAVAGKFKLGHYRLDQRKRDFAFQPSVARQIVDLAAALTELALDLVQPPENSDGNDGSVLLKSIYPPRLQRAAPTNKSGCDPLPIALSICSSSSPFRSDKHTVTADEEDPGRFHRLDMLR